MQLKPLALLMVFPCLANAAEIPVLEEILVTASRVDTSPLSLTRLGETTLAPQRASTSDSASLLRDIPGISLYGAGGISSLPAMHGLADDRLRSRVDGMDLIAACPNHMNSPLSYIDSTAVSDATVYVGVSPVSAGGDSLGGSIVLNSAAPEFAKPGQSKLLKGEVGAFYRSNADARGANLAATLASEQFSLGYTGSSAQADNYRAGGDFKTYTFTGRTGHDLPLDEVGSSAYKAMNQALKLGWKNDDHLFEFKAGQQHIPFENYPNQRMDMTDNVSRHFNLAYTGRLAWGDLKARTYYEHTQHEMDFGQDKRYWYGNGAPPAGSGGPAATSGAACSPISATCAAGMPMYSDGKNTGLNVSANIRLSKGDTLRMGGEYQTYRLDDWWTPSGAMMSPGTFWNISDGQRDRLALFGEWETRRDRWTHTLGLRHETVDMDAGVVRGYDPTSNAMNSFQKRDGDAFNARDHGKTDHNWDMSWLARFTPDATRSYEIGLAQKTRSPNLYERYTWSTWQMAALMNNFVGDGNGYVGNLDLKPEVARTLSLTGDWHAADKATWGFKATPYFTQVKDYIDAVQWDATTNAARVAPVTNSFTVLRYANQSAHIYGIDLSAHVLLASGTGYGDFTLKGLVNYTRGENHDTDGNLYNIMPPNARLALTHKFGPWRNTVEGEFVTRKNDVCTVRNETETAGYGLIHLRGRYEQKDYSVDFGIENLFDRRFHPPLGGAYVGQGTTMTNPALPNYPQWGTPVPGPGRSFYAGLNVKF